MLVSISVVRPTAQCPQWMILTLTSEPLHAAPVTAQELTQYKAATG